MLQLSEKWVRCESISGRDAETKIKPPRRLHQSPPLQTNVKVGQPPLTPLFFESDTTATYVDVDSQKVQTARRCPVTVGWVVRITEQVIGELIPVQVLLALLWTFAIVASAGRVTSRITQRVHFFTGRLQNMTAGS